MASPITVSAIQPARITLRGFAVAGGAWTVYTVLYSAAISAFADVPFGYVLYSQAIHTALMAGLGIVPWWILVRGLAEASIARRVLAHGVGLVTYTAAVVGGLLGVVWLLSAEGYAAVRAQVGWITVETAVAYVTQFAIYHAVEASRRARVQRRQAEALRHLAREQELRTLRSQLNPHFLFNALNTISAGVVRDPEGAREAIGQLAGLLRYALDTGRRDRVTLADEMMFVRDTLALERERMGERLDIRLDVDAEALDAEVPPFAVQTLVENAIRHGLAPACAGGTLTVSVQRHGAAVEVEVADTGLGATATAATAGSGIGLANTDERLRLLFGDAARLRIDRDRATGFAVSFRLPLDDAPPEAAPRVEASLHPA